MPNPESSGQTEQKAISYSDGPRTYRSVWVQDRLLTAEEWLLEEAHVAEQMEEADEEKSDEPGVLRAMAKEIATIRAERSYWAEAFTKQLGQIDALQRDAERLDWFEENRPRVGLGEAGEARLFAREAFGAMLGEAPTFREAIDKARSGAVSVLSGADQ